MAFTFGIDTQMKRMTAICLGFFLTDRMMSPDRGFSLEEMAEGLGETIHLAFEPEEPPSPEVIEEATQAFLRLFDQFLGVLQERHQAMDDEVDAE